MTTKTLEEKLFQVGTRTIEIGYKQKGKKFMAYENVREQGELRSRYIILSEKHFEAKGYYNRLLNVYNKKIQDLHGL
jgi:hypothetical protein